MISSDKCFIKDQCAKCRRGECVDNTFCIKLFKLDKLYENALVSDRQRCHVNLRIDADGTDRDEFKRLQTIQSDIIEFIKGGSNLYLYSTTCGNGKSSWALRLLQTYFNKVWPSATIECKALFINVPKFFLALKDNISHHSEYIQHIKDNVATCDLVIWDDIGTKVGTEFEIENLLNIINNRIDNGKSNIYTSNMNPEQLKERVGERLYSRIVNLSTNIELHGMDKRGL